MNKHGTLTNKQAKRKSNKQVNTLDEMFEKKGPHDGSEHAVDVENNANSLGKVKNRNVIENLNSGNNNGNVKRKKDVNDELDKILDIDDESDDDSIVERLVKRRKVVIESDEEDDCNTDSLNQLVNLIGRESKESEKQFKTNCESETNEKVNENSDEDDDILSRILSNRNEVSVEVINEKHQRQASQRNLLELDLDDDLGDTDEFLSGLVSTKTVGIKSTLEHAHSKSVIETRNEQSSQASQRSLFHVDFNNDDSDLEDADDFLSGVVGTNSTKTSELTISKTTAQDKRSEIKPSTMLNDRLKSKIDSLKRSFQTKTGDNKISSAADEENTERAISKHCGSNSKQKDRNSNTVNEVPERSSYFTNSSVGTKDSFDRQKLPTALFKLEKRKPKDKTNHRSSEKNNTSTDVSESGNSKNNLSDIKNNEKIQRKSTMIVQLDDKAMDITDGIFKTPLIPNTTEETPLKTPSNSGASDKTPLKSPLSNRTIFKLKMFSFEKTSKDQIPNSMRESSNTGNSKSPNNENNATALNAPFDKSTDSGYKQKDERFRPDIAHGRCREKDKNKVNVMGSEANENTSEGHGSICNEKDKAKSNENNILLKSDKSNSELNESLDIFSLSSNTQSTLASCERKKIDQSSPLKTTNFLDDLNESDFE